MLRQIIQLLQPLLVPICFGLAWLLVAALVGNMWAVMRDTVSSARRMHEIPCANCQFFTNTHYLKCPIHPKAALSLDAIDCSDYQPTAYRPMLEDTESRR